MFQSLRKMWIYTSMILLLSFTISFALPKPALADSGWSATSKSLVMALYGLTGYVILSAEAQKGALQHAWNNLSPVVKQKIENYDGSGIFEIDQTTWTDFREMDDMDDVTVTIDINGASGTLEALSSSANMNIDADYGVLTANLTYNGASSCLYQVTFFNGCYVNFYIQKTYISGVWNYRTNIKTNMSGSTVNYYGAYQEGWTGFTNTTALIEIALDGSMTAVFEDCYTPNYNLGMTTDYYNMVGATNLNVEYSHSKTTNLTLNEGEDFEYDPEAYRNPAWDMGGSTIENISPYPEDYIGKTAEEIAAGAVDTRIPVPVPETDGTEVGLLGGILQYLAQIRNLIANQNPATSADDPPINDQVPALGETFAEKTGYSVFEDTWEALQSMNTAQGNAPQIKINLHQLIDKSVGTIHASAAASNPFTDEEKVIFDFADFEEYSWGGFNLIQLFRTLVGFSMVYSTIMMAWRRIIPDKVIS